MEMEKGWVAKYAVYGITAGERVIVKWFDRIDFATMYAEKVRNNYDKVKLNWYTECMRSGGRMFIRTLQTWKR